MTLGHGNKTSFVEIWETDSGNNNVDQSQKHESLTASYDQNLTLEKDPLYTVYGNRSQSNHFGFRYLEDLSS